MPVIDTSGVKIIKYSELHDLSEIGSGACSTVYKATYNNTVVAVKSLRFDRQHESEVIKAMESELSKLKCIHHANVLHLEGAVVEPGHLCIVTEFCDGNTLHNLLHVKKHVLGLREVIRIGCEIALGMQYVHSLCIIHRDLKTANILLSKGTAKIADFGFARYNEDRQSLLTTIIGTPLNMSPELLNNSTYSEKIDIYAFSLILYEMYTNTIPYAEYTNDADKIKWQVGKKGRRPTFEMVPKARINQDLVSLISECWHQVDAERPSFEQITQKLFAMLMTMK